MINGAKPQHLHNLPEPEKSFIQYKSIGKIWKLYNLFMLLIDWLFSFLHRIDNISAT